MAEMGGPSAKAPECVGHRRTVSSSHARMAELIAAIDAAEPELVRTLLSSARALLHAGESNGSTVLKNASQTGQFERVRALLEACADVVAQAVVHGSNAVMRAR